VRQHRCDHLAVALIHEGSHQQWDQLALGPLHALFAQLLPLLLGEALRGERKDVLLLGREVLADCVVELRERVGHSIALPGGGGFLPPGHQLRGLGGQRGNRFVLLLHHVDGRRHFAGHALQQLRP